MAIVNRISEQEYRELALNEPDRHWELWDGVPREKPLMSVKHDNVSFYLGMAIANQLDRGVYRENVNGGKTRLSPSNYFIPDVVVIPAAAGRRGLVALHRRVRFRHQAARLSGTR